MHKTLLFLRSWWPWLALPVAHWISTTWPIENAFFWGWLMATVAWSLHRHLLRNRYGELHILIERKALEDWLSSEGIRIADTIARRHFGSDEPHLRLFIRPLSGAVWPHICDASNPVYLGMSQDGEVFLHIRQDGSAQGIVKLDVDVGDYKVGSVAVRTLSLARFPMRELEEYIVEGHKDLPIFASSDRVFARLEAQEKAARKAILVLASDAVFGDDLDEGFQIGLVHIHYQHVLSYSPG